MIVIFIFVIGVMGIIGVFDSGICGNYDVFYMKLVMDGFIVLFFSMIFGWGVMFFVILVFFFEGIIVLFVI